MPNEHANMTIAFLRHEMDYDKGLRHGAPVWCLEAPHPGLLQTTAAQ